MKKLHFHISMLLYKTKSLGIPKTISGTKLTLTKKFIWPQPHKADILTPIHPSFEYRIIRGFAARMYNLRFDSYKFHTYILSCHPTPLFGNIESDLGSLRDNEAREGEDSTFARPVFSWKLLNYKRGTKTLRARCKLKSFCSDISLPNRSETLRGIGFIINCKSLMGLQSGA